MEIEYNYKIKIENYMSSKSNNIEGNQKCPSNNFDLDTSMLVKNPSSKDILTTLNHDFLINQYDRNDLTFDRNVLIENRLMSKSP